MQTRLLDSKILENIKPHSVHVSMQNGQAAELLTVLQKEAYEEVSIMFGAFHTLEDNCVIKPCCKNVIISCLYWE